MNNFESSNIPVDKTETILFSELNPENIAIASNILKSTIERPVYGKDASKDDLNGLPSKLSEAGFSDEESQRIMSCTSEEDISNVLIDMQRKDLEFLEGELGNEYLKDLITNGVQQLYSIFESSGVDMSAKDIRVEHGGKVVRLINNIVKYGFVPIAASEGGEHFSENNRTNVYHTAKESPEMIATVHVHELTHGLAHNDHKKREEGESVANGFSRTEYNEKDPLKSIHTFNSFNEGFTEYLARKSFNGVIDYSSMPLKSYNDEIVLVESVIDAVSTSSQSERSDIEKEFIRAYVSGDGAEILKQLVNSTCGKYAYILLNSANSDFFKALEQYSKTKTISERIDIQMDVLEPENIDVLDFVKVYPFTRVVRSVINYETGQVETKVVANEDKTI